MCTVLLPPGDNPIAVNKYIKYTIINFTPSVTELTGHIRALAKARARSRASVCVINMLESAVCLIAKLRSSETLQILRLYVIAVI